MTTVQIETTNMQPNEFPEQQENPQQVYSPPSGNPETEYPQDNDKAEALGRYNKNAGYTTGILQIFAAAFLTTMKIVYGSDFVPVGWRLWVGVCFYGVTGIFGVISRNQSKCVMNTYMLMCILSVFIAGVNVIWDLVAVTSADSYYCDNYRPNDYYSLYSCSRYRTIQTMHAISAVTALAEMIIASVATAFCCSAYSQQQPGHEEPK